MWKWWKKRRRVLAAGGPAPEGAEPGDLLEFAKDQIAALQLVQIAIDGSGDDATLLGLTKSGKLYRCQIWSGDPWEEIHTPQSEASAWWQSRLEIDSQDTPK